MIPPEDTSLEPPDNQCERCERLSPQLFFNGVSQLLLCPRCLDLLKQEQAWSLLRDQETA
jgi:uncharacterized paraquat-inducible protein A